MALALALRGSSLPALALDVPVVLVAVAVVAERCFSAVTMAGARAGVVDFPSQIAVVAASNRTAEPSSHCTFVSEHTYDSSLYV